VQPLLDRPQRVTPFKRVRRWLQRLLIGYTERNTRLSPGNEGRKHGLVATWRDPEEVYDGYLVFERFPKPLIAGSLWILSHESVVDRLVSFENLPVHLPLVVIPDLTARLRENRFDR
jgi:hypothetical protein